MTRMLRRVNGSNIIPVFKEDDNASSEEDTQTKPNNRFEAFLAESDSEDGNKVSADDENAKPVVTKGVKKKSKKTKRKTPRADNANETQNEFDKTLEEFKKSYEDAEPSTSRSDVAEFSESVQSIYTSSLQLSLNHLNEKYEVKKKFGLDIQSAFSGHDVARYKQSKFIAEVLAYWPQLAQNSGISMRMLYKKNGCAYFVYDHSKSYQTASAEVIQALHSGEVELVIGLYHTVPFQVDLIMQMAEIAKNSEEMEKCVLLVERAVYLMEKAFHINFSSHMLKGTCRLESKYQVNRTFYRVMFQHMILLTSRASHRTALECAKFIFSLDPQDPYFVLLIIDSLALKSKEYEWLLTFIDGWINLKKMRQTMALPNLLYSKALATFHSNKTDPQAADDCLTDAISKYPHVVLLFVKAIHSLARRLPQNISSHAAFVSNQIPECLLTQLYPIYIKYALNQWEKSEDVLDWLADNIKTIFSDPNVQESSTWLEYKKQRQMLFASTQIPLKRHIVLADLEEIPLRNGLSTDPSILTWDPFPPQDSVNKYTYTKPQPERTSSHMLQALLRSLDPRYDIVNPN